MDGIFWKPDKHKFMGAEIDRFIYQEGLLYDRDTMRPKCYERRYGPPPACTRD